MTAGAGTTFPTELAVGASNVVVAAGGANLLDDFPRTRNFIPARESSPTAVPLPAPLNDTPTPLGTALSLSW